MGVRNTMTDRPKVSPADWIYIGKLAAVVAVVRPVGDPLGDCEVVFDPKKPTNRDVKWTGERWEFVESGDYGGDADKYQRLAPYVARLKNPAH
jgi:hypothetical protein